MIIAIVVVAVLVLGGAGTAIFFLTGGDDNPNSADPGTSQANPPGPAGDDGGNDGDSPPPAGSGEGDSDSPEAVQRAYIDAYESKQFTSVVESACAAYKDKFGTDTSRLESQLAPYDIKATADGEPDVTGSEAIAKIDLELTKGSETKPAKIRIKIVKEAGKWRFCGEGEA